MYFGFGVLNLTYDPHNEHLKHYFKILALTFMKLGEQVRNEKTKRLNRCIRGPDILYSVI